MTFKKLLIAVGINGVFLLGSLTSSYACGVWQLDDLVIGRTINFNVRTVTLVNKHTGKGGSIFVLKGNAPDYYIPIGKEKLVEIKEQQIFFQSKKVGSIDGNKVLIGDHQYELVISSKKKLDCQYQVTRLTFDSRESQ